ncbi:hypothetical protein [Brasilonema sp. UFV-L1]|uniref:hypothetical protein n=1 Tax=Brasilonema sp. UFV-L1 TaxID=2234130 RepID=UPI00145FAA05|nr:hypothetical protein [Brasilonema sp. UFV-L1]NMG07793.1 hypothetical protein [Brasilonema sp. UFV-L1]
MTQHPFEHELSEQKAAKLNAEQEPKDTEQELTDEDTDQVAGGSIAITKGINEGGGHLTWGIGEQGGGILKT